MAPRVEKSLKIQEDCQVTVAEFMMHHHKHLMIFKLIFIKFYKSLH